jgi:uncharacterized protein (UPF0335 family)
MEAFDVKVDLELLDVGQQTELIDLTGRIRYSEKSKPPPASPRAELERFVKRVESLTEEARGPNQKANLGLLVDRARTTGRVPNRDEKKTILDNKDIAATIGSLRLPNHDPQVVARGIRLNELDEAERRRLEELVELAADAEPGSIFEARREKQRLSTKLAEYAAMVADGPRKRRRIDEPGVVSIPMGVWEDVIRSDGNGIWLQAVDPTTLTTVLYALETRKLPPHAAASGLLRLEDDDNTLVVRKGTTPWGALADQGDELQGLFVPSLKRLAHCRWLALAEANGMYRISRGPRMLEFLQKREEV